MPSWHGHGQLFKLDVDYRQMFHSAGTAHFSCFSNASCRSAENMMMMLILLLLLLMMMMMRWKGRRRGYLRTVTFE
jgi:hypothetical protein